VTEDVRPGPALGLREQHKRTTRRALEDAALERFARDGFDETSVEMIAADAGVSPRTFFRYFASKDEVLDMGRQQRQAALREQVLELAGTELSGLELVARVLAGLAAGFEEDRERVGLRQRAAASSPVLRGRLYDTFASWEHTLAEALAERDLAESDCETLAAVGLSIFRTATARWLREPEADLVVLVEEAFVRLR